MQKNEILQNEFNNTNDNIDILLTFYTKHRS